MQHAFGERLDALRIEAGEPGQIGSCRLRRRSGHGRGDFHQHCHARRIARPGLRRQRRHAVFAGQPQLRRIGQCQRRQGLQRIVLGAGDGGEEAQPVAQAVALGKLLEALRAGGEDRRGVRRDDMRRLAARLDRDDGGLGGGAHCWKP
jgi:hypothetical protein